MFRYPHENPDSRDPRWVQCAVRGSHNLHSARPLFPEASETHQSTPPRPRPATLRTPPSLPPRPRGGSNRPDPSPSVLCSSARRLCIRGMRPGVVARLFPPSRIVRDVSSAAVGIPLLPPPPRSAAINIQFSRSVCAQSTEHNGRLRITYFIIPSIEWHWADVF